MKKRLISALLALVMVLGMLPGMAFAAGTPEDALGEVDIYNSGESRNYLTVNGKAQRLTYTYYNYTTEDGQSKELPAYCVNPTDDGVPQVVSAGQSIAYMADERASDPKVVGIISCGYPTQGLSDLGLQDKYEGYYATKIALWCYLIGGWSISGLKVNPNCTDSAGAQRVLAAAQKIYSNGASRTTIDTPNVTITADQSLAYDVEVNGQSYKQQIFTLHSDTWVYDYDIAVAFSDSSNVPAGTKIVDMNNREITAVTTEYGNGGYDGQFKVLYPADAVAGQDGSVKLEFSARVRQFAVYFAVCAEQDQYGKLQNYVCDTDPVANIELSTFSTYGGDPVEMPDPGDNPSIPSENPDESDEPDEPENGSLKIIKLETGTETPLAGAIFEVVGPDGDTIGSFSTDSSGTISVPEAKPGNYTVYERSAPAFHLIGKDSVQNVTVQEDQEAEVTFYNDPYGDLRVEKYSDTGEGLAGVTFQIKHIESGATQSAQTGPGGAAQFTQLKPGAYEVRETAGITGWQADTETIQTVTVVAGQCSTATFTNKELPGLRIIKYDRTSLEALTGITFRIWRDGELLGDYKTDQLGQVTLTNAQPGTYLVSEVQSDDDHITVTTPQQVELKAGDGIKELVFFNDLKPGIHLIKVDSADLSTPIANAKFKFEAVDGSWGPVEMTTLEDGTIDLSKLPTGAVVVTELECPGYVIDEAQRIIELKPNENAQFVFTNSKLPSLHLMKTSSDGTPLAGVSFRLAKIEDGSRYLDRTTTATGEILWEGLEPGVYSLKETATVADHIIDLREYHVELFPGKTSEICIENQKRPNLTVYKRDADSGAPVADTIFTVRAADGHSVDEIKTDANGKATLENLLPGVYEISEKSVPSPYLMDAPSQLVTLYPNRNHDVYFENHKAPIIEIIKEDSITHDRLANVRFQVWYASNNTSTGELNDLGIFTTDESGRIELTGPDNGLRDGWFRVKELAPPKGYSIKDSDTQEAFVQAGKSYTFRFENQPLSAIVVYKYDEKTNQALEGAEFEIKYLGGTSGTGGTSIGTFKTSSNGTFTVTGLQAGTYVITETRSSPYYSIDTAPQTVYLSGNDQDVITVRFGNQPYGTVLLKKLSDDTNKTPLEGATFLVTDDKGAFIGNANGEYTTGKDGSIQLPKVPSGTTIVAREIRAPEGYSLDSTPQTVYVQPGEVHSLTFYDKALCSFTLLKRDAVTKEPLPNAEFTVTDVEGRAIGPNNGRYVTGRDGTFTLTGLEPDSVLKISESKAPTGYVLDETPHTVVVKSGAINSLTVDNQPTTTLVLHKYIEGTDYEPLAGVCFKVTDGSGAAVGPNDGIYYSDAAGEVAVTGLEPGTTVIAREIKTVEGFVLDGTPQDILIKGGQVQNLYFWNKKAGTLVLQKKDKVSGELISGAQFQLTYADGSYVDADNGHLSSKGLYETDSAGEIRISGIVGTVVAKEVQAAPGYVIDSATQTQTVTVNPQDTQTLVFLNEPLCSLTLTKLDSVTGKPIPNTTFTLKDGSGNLIGRYTTGADGTVTVTGLVPGSTVVATEYKVPDTHVLNTTPQTITLKSGTNTLTSGAANSAGETTGNNASGGNDLVFENDPKMILTIKKYVKGTNYEPLAGVCFKVTDGSGAAVGSGDGTYYTNSAGEIVIEGLEPGTTVTAREIATVDGFVLDGEPKSVKITASNKAPELIFWNEKAGSIVIRKLDSLTNEPLAGVQFQLTYADGSYVDADNGHMSSKGLYETDAAGEIRIAGITGTVIVREIKTINGYSIDPTAQSQTVQINPDDCQTLTFYNTPVGGVEIIKVSEVDRTQRIPNVTFEIRKMDDALVDTITTGDDGRVYLALDAGSYYAVETACPKEFKLDDTPHYFTVEDGKNTTLTVTNKAFSGILLHKIDSVTKEGIYGVTFILYDSTHTPIDQFTSDDRGYVYIEGLTDGGRYYLRELENEGYIVDTELKTVYVKSGETTLVEWQNTPITAQIQITKKSADYNPTNGLPAGTLLEGAVFEIYDKAGNLVDTIKSDSRGAAVSTPLPLGRYTIREVKAPTNYGISGQDLTAYLEHEGEIVHFEVTNKSLTTGVSITKTGPSEIMAGQPVRYVFSNIANNSNVMLTSFYWRDTLPAEVWLDSVVTGTYNFPGTYKITYRVNGGEPRTLADNLSTGRNYTLAASATALGLASNERVTEIMFVFGQAPAGFAQVEKPMLYCTAVKSIAATSFVNVADVGGVYDGVWVQAVSRWVTNVYGKTVVPALPKTGY